MLQRPAIAINSSSSLYVRARGIDGVEIWRMESDSSVVVATIPMNQSVIGISWFSESQVALFGKNGGINVYNIFDVEDEITVEQVDNAKLDLRVTLKSFVALGSKIVFGDEHGAVWLAKFDKSWLLAKSQGHKSSVDTLVFSPDGSRIASAGRDKTIKIWSSEILNDTTLEATHSQVLDFFSVAYDESFDSSVNDQIPTISSNEVLDFFSIVEDSEPLGGNIELAEDTIAEASPFSLPSPDSPELVHLNCLATLEGSEGWAIALEFSSDAKRLVSGAMDNRVYLWDINEESLISSQERHEGWVSSVAFSSGDKLIASGSWDKNICLYDGQTLEWLETMKFHRDYVVDVEFQNAALYSASYDGLIAKWNIETYKIEEILDSDSDWIQAIRFLNDATLISVCSDGSSVQWSLPTNEIVWKTGQALSAGIKVGESSELYAYMNEASHADSLGTEFLENEAHPNSEVSRTEVETVEAPRDVNEDTLLEASGPKPEGQSAPQERVESIDPRISEAENNGNDSKTEAVSESFVLSAQSVASSESDAKLELFSKTEAVSESFVLSTQSVASEDDIEAFEDVESKPEEQSVPLTVDAKLESERASEESAVSQGSDNSKPEEQSEPLTVDAKLESESASEESAVSQGSDNSKPEEQLEPHTVDAKLESESSSEESAVSQGSDNSTPEKQSEPLTVDAKLESESSSEENAVSHAQSEAAFESSSSLGNDRSLGESLDAMPGDQFKGVFISQHFKFDSESSIVEKSEQQIDPQNPADTDAEIEIRKDEIFETLPKTRHKKILTETPILIQKVELSPLVAADIPSEVLDEMINEIGGLDDSIDDEWKSPFDKTRFGAPEISESIVVDVAPETKAEEISSADLLHESSELRALSPKEASSIPLEKTEFVNLIPKEKGAVLTLPSDEELADHETPSSDKITNHNQSSRDKKTQNDFPKETTQQTSTPSFAFDSAPLVEPTNPATTEVSQRELTNQVPKLAEEKKTHTTKVDHRVPNEPVVPQGFQSNATKVEEVSLAEIFIQRKRSSSSRMGVVKKLEPIPTRFEKYVTIRTPHDSVYGIALSDDGSRIASCGDSHLCIWSRSGELIHKLQSPTAGLNAIIFTYDERIVVAAGDDGNIHVWFLPHDKKQLIQHAMLPANQVWVTSMDISADMRTLISAGYDGTARIWDLSTGECVRTLSGHTGPVTGIKLGARTYTCGADGTIRVWNDVWKLVDQHHGFDKLTGIATHGTNICITAANGDVFSLRNGTLIPLLRHRGEARATKMRSDGVSASAGEDGLVMFYQPDFETPYAVIKLSTPIWDVAFNHDFCVIAGDDGRIYLHRTQ